MGAARPAHSSIGLGPLVRLSHDVAALYGSNGIDAAAALMTPRHRRVHLGLLPEIADHLLSWILALVVQHDELLLLHI